MVVIPAVEGEMGVYPMHVPLMTQVKPGELVVRKGAETLHRGIATRPFRQTFNLAEHVKVTDARFEHGLLIVDLKREVPDALKPRRIEIGIGSGVSNVPQSNVTTLEQSKVA